jgi:hypothetical protein
MATVGLDRDRAVAATGPDERNADEQVDDRGDG